MHTKARESRRALPHPECKCACMRLARETLCTRPPSRDPYPAVNPWPVDPENRNSKEARPKGCFRPLPAVRGSLRPVRGADEPTCAAACVECVVRV